MAKSRKAKPREHAASVVLKGEGSIAAKGAVIKGAARVEGVMTPDGRDAWRITSGDKVFSLTTSSSSTAVIDEAVKLYAPALKRLAKR